MKKGLQKENKLTQKDLLMEYFMKHPNKDIRHPEVVDWVTSEWNKRTGEVFRDPDRGIRSLSQTGILIKVAKGIYRYDPDFIKNRELEDFTEKQKKEILKRGNYCCAICGKGKKDGVELHIDHIKPKELGGRAIVENGQILCAQHNFLKKTLNQTTTGKKLFVNLYELAKKSNDVQLMNFCSDILNVFEAYNMNGHIEWKK